MNFWDAISFRHSNWKTSHRVTKRSKAITFENKVFLFILPILKTYLPKVCWVAQHVHIEKLRHISAPVCVIFLSERWADSSTLFLDHLTLLRLGPCCPDSPDQLPQSDRSWHSLENIKKINKQTISHDGTHCRQADIRPDHTKTEKLHFSWKNPHKSLCKCTFFDQFYI